jgi:cation transport ATPase
VADQECPCGKSLGNLCSKGKQPSRVLPLRAELADQASLDAYRDGIGDPAALVVIVIGATPLIRHTIVAVREHRYALDYMALLAIAAALVAIEFQVGAVIALMLASGEALEDYGDSAARRSPTTRRRAAECPPWWTSRR